MFLSPEAKIISNLIRTHSTIIRPKIRDAFENSIVGCSSEVNFIHKLVNELSSLFANLPVPGLSTYCRSRVIHKKPIVQPVTKGNWGPCELGDLLVVMKYQLSTGAVEAKSIIYQVKLANGRSSICDIDHNQLTLLSDWPPFEFGLKAQGGPCVYHLNPTTLEFGSFMLELRASVLLPYIGSYGICPPALLVRSHGPSRIDIVQPIYARKDSNNFFSHLAFEIGESHSTRHVKDLIDALYRHHGLDPDPPDEFKGYSKEANEGAFGILEINVNLSRNQETEP